MFPSPQPLPGDGLKLEDRLRGLILNNANSNGHQHGLSPPAHASQMVSPAPAGSPGGAYSSHAQEGAQAASENAAHTGNRKRPNQAQRRQLNSQLSIPIDPRPNSGTPAGHSPGYQGPQNHMRPQQNFNAHPPLNQNPRYRQQYSPRYPNPMSPYSPRTFQAQPSPQSPMHPYQSGPSPQFQVRQGPAQFQHYNGNNISRPQPQNRQLYQPGPQNPHGGRRPMQGNPEDLAAQSDHLQRLVEDYVPHIGIDPAEEAEKESFRALVEELCRESITEYERSELENVSFDPLTVELQCFGSMKSGFATKASDMDLALLSPLSHPAPDAPESAIPRLLEKKLLSHGYGARLLTRTRVPIIKLCEKPTEKLLADLLEERDKWEGGCAADADDEDEDVPVNAVHEIDSSKPKPSDPKSPPAESHQQKSIKEGSLEHRLASLKQKENQSLGDYYNSAKRMLRKVGGRDITASSADLTEEEGRILNATCKAFIEGLFYKPLAESLRKYETISPLYDSTQPFLQRTLHGVWTQIEGERLASAWETRPLEESSQRYDYDCFGIVEAWRELQNKKGPTIESLVYNRQLTTASERLRKISSLQLVCLEQIQFEDPIYYFERTQRLQKDLLTGRDRQYADSTRAIIVAHYIAGINNSEIRETLQGMNHNGAGLQQINLYHRALNLALDYEHGLKTGVFDEGDVPDVEKYVDFLRTLELKPKTDIELALLTKIRTLPDPTLTSANKPRNKYRDHLEFPKTDIGIQCDINFSAHLAIHNTQLLRCYSQSDPRVKDMILFVKHWAKIRGINTPYRGTLSSYGYVLMVLHYLVNIAQPFVCQNLQTTNQTPPPHLLQAEREAVTTCDGRDVRFWRNETQIKNLADQNQLTNNQDSIGKLLRGFFEYYAQKDPMTTFNTPTTPFDWGREVLSLRTIGGILTKQDKNWTGAKTVTETTRIAAPPTPSSPYPPHATISTSSTPNSDLKINKHAIKTIEEVKEIRHRYLFAIEDPFELDHNVARTVTHDGIVKIRDELRRAWRIISAVYAGGGSGSGSFGAAVLRKNRDGGIMDPVVEEKDGGKGGLVNLMDLLHGKIGGEKLGNEGEGKVGVGAATVSELHTQVLQ